MPKQLFIISSVITGLLCMSSIFGIPNTAHADSTTNTQVSLGVNSVINISVPSVATLNCTASVNPATANLCTTTTSIGVATNNMTGYTLQMNATNGYATDLVNASVTPHETISTLDNAYPVATPATFPANTWGYTGGVDKSSVTGGYNCTNDPTHGNYCPILPYSSGNGVTGSTSSYAPNHVIKETTVPATVSTTDITFAAKVDVSKPSGTYSSSVTLTAIANYAPYTALELKDGLYMQQVDSTTCSNTRPYSETNKIYTLIDARDNTQYTVAKLADGKCWMTQNLELGEYGKPMTLTNELSNVSSEGYTLNFEFANASHYKNNSNRYGNYYTWPQATAGSGTTIAAGEDAPYSVCPKNWRLPKTTTTEVNSEFYTLLNKYITTGTWVEAAGSASAHWEGVTTTQFSNEPVSLILSGAMKEDDGNLYGQRELGYWRSSTSNNGLFNTFNLAASIDGRLYPRSNNGIGYGFTIRCLVNQ